MSPDEAALQQTIFSALRSALSLSASEADQHILRAYTGVPAAEPSPTTDLCYYFLQTDPASKILQESDTRNSQYHAMTFIPCRLTLSFYGPSCESWAHRCRSFFFMDGASSPRRILREASLYPVPFPQPPSVIYEETGKTWRKRTDLVIDLRLLDDSAYGSAISGVPESIDTVQSVPDVKIHCSELR